VPAFVLHQGATVMCVHGGQAQPAAPNPRVKVAGQPVVTQAVPYTIAGCPFTVGSSPSPCVTAQWITASTRVKAGGMPVLLQNSQAVCAPNGTGLNIVVTQTRARAT
jgi:uncharacterized Zn-binding protein involved in type VI secretion